MSNKKKILFLFCLFMVVVILLISFLVIHDAMEEQKLKKEIHALTQLDITRDRYQTSIKSSGQYGKIEKVIKEYLDEYAASIQQVFSVMQDSQFKQLLSIANYESDGPDFLVSFSYIQKRKQEFNQSIDLLIQKCDAKQIKNAIYEELDDEYYVHLYEEMMLNDDMQDDFKQSVKRLVELKQQTNQLFDLSSQVLTFLKMNKEAWKLEDNQIQFQTQELVNQYNTYVNKIKEISN